MAPPLAGVVRLAAASRVLVLALSLLSRLLFRPYDTSATLHPPCLSSSATPSTSAPSTNLSAAISSLAVWDGVHFARPAECGYEYEQSYAFLPLLPASIALLPRSLFAPLVPVLGYGAVLVLSGLVLNNVAFVASAAYFYRLSVLILKDRKAAYRASVLFCFNPASVFYSSLYSESLYALFSLGGLFYLFSGANTVAVIMLAISSSARSNGALNAGYFCFQALLRAYDAAVNKKRPLLVVRTLIAAALRSIFIFLPFFAFQAYGYFNICVHGSSEKLRPWCKAKVPLLYGFIQSHYWGVGFLRYFQVKQLPNFLLATPTLSLAVYAIIHYTKILHQLFQTTSIQRQITTALEARSIESYKRSDDVTVSSELSAGPTNKAYGNSNVKQRKSVATETVSATFHDAMSANQNIKENQHEGSILLLPFVLHLAFMTFTAFFVMHVQVSTRFLSASPPIYWAAAHILASPNCTSKRWGYLICAYFIAYILLGSLLFSNFYPFT
ncbi:hypothetical protein HU200_065877 [Digitaria exilis]|uniref:GPI mannosyltransferase 2 n=1 Tax=Digitaria exilis TaxID=1010633 RepID=A0A835A7C8_9POAL|nr:hypothetical protein HU200_065877 [Digitaria exilis]